MRIQTNEGEDRISSLVDKYNLTDESGRYSYERVQEAKRNLVGSWGEAFGVLADVADVLRENPRASVESLFENVNKKLNEVGDKKLRSLTGTLLSRLYDRHRRVLEFYDRLGGNPQEIYRELFGLIPSGDVEVRLGPSCLNVICTRDDFKRALLHVLAKYYPESQVPSLYLDAGGIHFSHISIPTLCGGVNMVVKDSWMREEDVRKLIAHEEAHALFTVTSMELPVALGHTLERFNKSLESGDRRQAYYWLTQHLRSLRSASELRFASEILAFAADDRFDRNEILKILTRYRNDGSLRDFATDVLDVAEGNFRFVDIGNVFYFFRELGLDRDKIEALGWNYLRSGIIKVFSYELADLVDEGLVAIERLKSRGYTYNEILHILSQFPLRRWRQASCRFAEQRQIPFDKFFVRSFTHSFGVPVVVADKDGNIYSDNRFQLDRYVSRGDQAVALFSYRSNPDFLPVPVMREVDLGQPDDLDSIVQGIDEEPPIRLALMSADALRALNYPYKTPKDWYDIWVRSGGDPKVKDELDFSSQEPVPATEIWGKFRKYAKPGSRELSVFRAYRRIQREAF